MFNAKVYTVMIPSSGVALEEEHIAREVIARWNIEEGEKHRVVFLTIPNNYRGITPDICIFAIGNFVDKTKVEAAIATGTKVLLFFRKYRDEESTISSELQAIQELRASTTATCIDYNGPSEFNESLNKMIKSFSNQ